MSNRFFITVIILIAVFFGAFTLTKQKKSATSPNTNTSQPTNHVKGEGKSGVVLIEYGDLQCPACGQYYPIVKQVYDKYKDQITVQFRHFPLVQIHPNAFVASRAAEAAAKQNKFWEMHDLLYENQETWGGSRTPNSFFTAYAKQLGLDTTKFQQDMDSQETNNFINADISEGKKIGADSTPTFVLDGKKLESNPRSIDEFYKIIDDAIAAKTPKS